MAARTGLSLCCLLMVSKAEQTAQQLGDVSTLVMIGGLGLAGSAFAIEVTAFSDGYVPAVLPWVEAIGGGIFLIGAVGRTACVIAEARAKKPNRGGKHRA